MKIKNKLLTIMSLLAFSFSNSFGLGSILNESLITEENKKFVELNEIGQKIDIFYKDGKKYFNGEIGVSESTKLYLVKCPYKSCKEDITENKVTSFNKDYKSGIILFRKSVEVFENKPAAIKGLTFLLRQLNYRERRYSQFLVDKWKTKIGPGYEMPEYTQDIILFAEFLSKENNLLGHKTMGELHYFGVLGKEWSKDKAKFYYDKGFEYCKGKQNFDCSLFKDDYKSKF